MSEEKKENVKQGYVASATPKKPVKEGYTPPPSPKKPATGKKG
jgi:hypothetical protein